MALANYFLPLKSKVKPLRDESNHFLRVIALGRFIYGSILLAAGLAISSLLGKNLSAELLRLMTKWHIDTHLYYVHWLFQKVSSVSHTLLILLAVANCFYAALAFIESAGLIFGKRWAYWLVIVDTASFIPIETYQLYKQFGWVNFVLLLYYLTTTIYLLSKLKRTRAVGR
jgi:uncharacterized membrane protein (DUF2068 family)